MFNTTDELLQAIELGEDSSLELKRVVFSGAKIKGPSRDDISDEMAAFANARGGVMVFGVDDKTREIIGIPLDRLDAIEDMIREIANDILEPPLPLHIRRMRLPDTAGVEQNVIRADIDRSLFVHASRGRYWVRVGSSKRKISPDYLARLMQQRSQARLIRFDEQIVPNTTVDTLDQSLTDRYRTERSDRDQNTFLHKIAMVGEDPEGILRPTVCGILLGCKRPTDYLTGAFIQAVAYRGNASDAFDNLQDYQLDAADIEGSIDQQVRDACRFIDRNMKVSGSKDAGRSDMPQFDLTAVFEAMVNAVAHRDYSISGSKIRLQLYNDRLELYVPGDLSNSMDVTSLVTRQSARNEAVTSLLARTKVNLDLRKLQTSRSFMMDRRGEGVNQILDRSEALSGKIPIYKMLDDSELMLTIFAANPKTMETRTTREDRA